MAYPLTEPALVAERLVTGPTPKLGPDLNFEAQYGHQRTSRQIYDPEDEWHDEIHLDEDTLDARLIYATKVVDKADGVIKWQTVRLLTALDPDPIGALALEIVDPHVENPEGIDEDLPAYLESLMAEGSTWHKWRLHDVRQLRQRAGLGHKPKPLSVSIAFTLWRQDIFPPRYVDPDWWNREAAEIEKVNPEGVANWYRVRS